LFIQAGHPVISVDAQKKGLIGDAKNSGRSWQRDPESVNVHDFLSDAVVRATPYGCRKRNWKKQLQDALVEPCDQEVMVCHYPTGTSKWNPIKHRLFSFISMNWAGVPLRSLKIMLNLIRGTTTSTGLKVQAALIKRIYPTNFEVSDQGMTSLNLHKRRICTCWNYIIKSRARCTPKV
jgi:Rhodopirellula transposase DDE domain